MSSKIIKYNGKFYKSIAELAREMGIKSVTLRTRLRKGMPIDEAVSNKNLSCREVTFNNKKYNSLTELCEEAGVSRNIVQCRLQRGETIEKAVTKELSITKQGKSGIYNGVPYKSIKSLADKLGIEESKMRRELKKLN